jgi:hypothetical protein
MNKAVRCAMMLSYAVALGVIFLVAKIDAAIHHRPQEFEKNSQPSSSLVYGMLRIPRKAH